MSKTHPMPLPLKQVTVQDPFWSPRMEILRERTIPHQWDALNDRLPDTAPSHVISDLKKAGGLEKGEFRGILFQDSDLAKWLETLSYRLATHPDKKWEKTAEEAIDLLEAAQQEDGYLNSYFIVAKPEEKWTNLRDWHELYVGGHLIEAAVAYFEATGSRRFLDIMIRFVDLVDGLFGPEEGKRRGYPGHEEIELALIRLYRVTGEERFLRLCRYFIDERGRQPFYFAREAEERKEELPRRSFRHPPYTHFQSHLPVRDQEEAVGHAVRAMYLFSGMTDVAVETGEDGLADACRRLWRNVTRRRMYVTGGVGSLSYGEAFTFDYDLPPERSYTETCAAIGLVFWAHRMLQLEPLGEYADVMERALYNGVLSGISLDGERYFYVNPLEVWPEACEKRDDLRHVKLARQPWFGCACCPPNISRLLGSLGRYIASAAEESLFVHLYVGGELSLRLKDQDIRLVQETGYPWTEEVSLTVKAEEPVRFSLRLRLPGWCSGPKAVVNGTPVDLEGNSRQGYLDLSREWRDGDTVALTFPMPVERIRSHPEVRAAAGKAALQRGPLVYCLEEADNGPNLQAILLPGDAQITARRDEKLLGGVTVLEGRALRVSDEGWDESLYGTGGYSRKEFTFKAIPYYAWANRGPGEMAVWIREA